MCRRAQTFITDYDLFGHPISLNFNSKGSEHKTFCGGTISFLTYGFLIWYLYKRIEYLVTFNNNSIDLTMDEADFEAIGEVPMWSDEGVMPFFILADYQILSDYTYEETKKYVQFHLMSQEFDYEHP